MAMKAVVVTASLFLACLSAAVAPVQQRAAEGPDARISRLEQWISTALRHDPGEVDDDIAAVGRWSDTELQVLNVDVMTVVRILRTPTLAGAGQGLAVYSVSERGQSRRVPYTTTQALRVKEIACALGLSESPSCGWAREALAGDSALAGLTEAARSVAGSDGNFMLRRGALVHTDIAMHGLAAPHQLDSSPGTRIRMSIADGQQAGLTEPDLHWEFARKLLDQITAPGSIKAAPAQDRMVRQWYVATTAWMQFGGHHDNTHIGRGLEIFADDADLAMLAGAQHEAYATPAIQTAVRSAVLPTGVHLEVASERSELRDAERFLRRATELRPDFAEAHIRLGRVLALTGKDEDALDHLTRGLTTTDRLLQYYGWLFLGAVEARLGHEADAKTSYEHASALYPRAQSPLLGLSEVARAAGRREEALRQMDRVYALEGHTMEDEPWWTYTYAQGRASDELVAAVEKPFRRGDRP